MKYKTGDWVEVRSKEEILATLDKNGRLEGLPFMPQMFQYCGKRFQVYKRAHKTCDTVNQTGGRRLINAVHLDTRCDGVAYGGCQAACLIFWKNSWLMPVDNKGKMNVHEGLSLQPELSANNQSVPISRCTEADVWAGTHAVDGDKAEQPRYVCQATQLPYFTTFLPWWDIRQYWEDYVSKNATLGRILSGFIYAGYYKLAGRRRLGRPFRWIYDKIAALWGGAPFPRKAGVIPAGQATPAGNLNLQPGDLVRVKSYNEILKTITADGKNRGLSFDAELVRYCGGVYRVRTRVNRFIDEKTGAMLTMNTDAVILEGVWCRARYSNCRMFCPRSIYSWWREIWLERVSDTTEASSQK